MAIRNDFTIDWEQSPRVIIIDAPSTECTMQDLLDTLRWEESRSANMDNKPIVSASGKEPLGGGTKVGITVSLLNAVVGFEARSGPDWIVCNLSGGNLVAFDTDGVTTINPTYPTAFVSRDRTSSASATLQEQDALNYSSYGGMVSVDVVNGEAGTVYPIGNQEHPVNNFTDAQTIANEKGFREIGIRESATIGSTIDFTGFRIHGISHVSTVVDVNASSILDHAVLTNIEITGSLDSYADVTNCIVRSLLYFNGHIHNSALGGTITLAGDKESFLSNCTRLENETLPTIDFNNGDNHLVLANYTGAIKVINMTISTTNALIGISRGRVILDTANCTAGTLSISGVGELVDELGNNIQTGTWNGMTITNKLISNDSIADAVWDELRGEIVKKMLSNKATKSGDIITIYEDNGVDIWKQFDLSSGGRVEI